MKFFRVLIFSVMCRSILCFGFFLAEFTCVIYTIIVYLNNGPFMKQGKHSMFIATVTIITTVTFKKDHGNACFLSNKII